MCKIFQSYGHSLRSLLLKKAVLLLALLWSVLTPVGAQFIGIPQITTYPFNEYEAGGQNYKIRVSQEGVIYVANNFGLLRFDGSSWERFITPGGTKVRSLLLTDDQRIYIGAQNELGYFEPNELGTLNYHSLMAMMPREFESFGDVWKIHQMDDLIVFSTTGTSFIWDGDGFSVIPSSSFPGFTSMYQDQLLTQSTDQSVMVWKRGRWEQYSGQPDLMEKTLVTVFDLNEEEQLWFTRKGGIIKRGVNSETLFAPTFTTRLAEATITTAVRLQSGEIAVGTQSAGLFIFNNEGDLIYHFNKDRGLKTLTVNDITQDANGVLWVSLNNNISKIHWSYPFSFINDELDLPGTGYASVAFEDQLFFGTNNGLFSTELSSMPIEVIRKIPLLNGQINNLQIMEDQLLISADEGVFQKEGDQILPVDLSVGWWTFIPTGIPGKILGGSYEGLGLFQKVGNRWKLEKKFPGFQESSRVMCQDEDGSIWMAHGYKGIYRIRFSSSYDSLLSVDFYGVDKGLPSSYLNNVFSANGELLFGADSGLFKYNPAQDVFERHPYFDTLIGPEVHTRYIEEDESGDIYFLTNEYCGVLRKDPWKGYQLEKNQFNGIFPMLNDDLAQIIVLEDNQILFTANTGFIHYNSKVQEPSKTILTKINSIELTNSGKFIHQFYTVLPGEDQSTMLPYQSNALAFNYASLLNQFEEPSYSYRLIGFRDEKWSDWTEQSTKEFTNLFEGYYQFQVRSRDVMGNMSDVISYSFVISPPWYRTTFAYVGYFLLFISTFFVSFYAYRRRYKKEKLQLIENQKHEIKIKDTELTQLMNDKLESEISHKKRQLASSTMHLLDKNDLLTKLKSQINSLAENAEIDSKSVKDMKRMAREIDRNIDKDKSWEQFEIHFDEVHGDFLKRLSSEFDNVTPQEIKLAAYLRMNMTTKEIANLLKISVRGVEIARYRLRKKLNLNQGQNLVDYMIKY